MEISAKQWWHDELSGLKHLPGKHEQQSHAGDGGSFSETRMQDGQRVMSDGSPLPKYLAEAKVRIPPAWTQVIVSRDSNNGLWVKGRDAKRSEKFPEGRPTAIYSPDFKEQSAHIKYARCLEMAEKFGHIRKENDNNMQSKDPEIRESASVTKLIMSTGIRPGSERDTGAVKKAYGATTLEGRHVIQDKDGVRLEFVGKKGKSLSIPIRDKEVIDMVIQRARSAGPDGKLFNVDDDRLRDYTHTLDGGKFKTKDFRTLLGTKTAIDKIKSFGDQKPKSEKEYKKMVHAVAVEVSTRLGNTPAVALQSYINPVVFKGWQGNYAMSANKTYGLGMIFKGGPGSGNWEGPGRPRFAREDVVTNVGRPMSHQEFSQLSVKERADILDKSISDAKIKGIFVQFWGTDGILSSTDVAERIELSIGAKAHLDIINNLPSGVKLSLQYVYFYPPESKIGGFTINDKYFEKGGEYDFKRKAITAKFFSDNADVLNHEIGHAVNRALQVAAINGFQEKFEESKGDISKMFDMNGNIKNPSTINQQAYVLFKKISTSPEDMGFVSDYAKSWAKEGIIDIGVRKDFQRADGSIYNRSFVDIHRSANENFAEMWKDYEKAKSDTSLLAMDRGLLTKPGSIKLIEDSIKMLNKISKKGK